MSVSSQCLFERVAWVVVDDDDGGDGHCAREVLTPDPY